jgi:hypothetical protein
MENKQGALRLARQDMESLERAIEVLESLPDPGDVYMFSTSANTYHSTSTIMITMPFDLPTYQAYRRKLAAAGWKVVRAFIPNSGNRQAKFALDGSDVELVIVLNPGVAGSTCTREKVGEQTQTVFRVRCE